MNEDFLHFIWKHQLFDISGLVTVQGLPVTIDYPGDINHDSGPDFLSARMSIDNESWAGNVEIHLNSDEWYQHAHNVDPAYDSVILHVVYEHGQTTMNTKLAVIQTVELKDRLNMNAFNEYMNFLKVKNQFPCQNKLSIINKRDIQNALEIELRQRLTRKSSEIHQLVKLTSGDLREAFYRTLARNFGFRINSVPFGLLASNLPLSVIEKNQFNPFIIEALIFGVAGFLEDQFIDPYPYQLQREFKFQRKKYNLEVLPAHIWKMSRLRPNNFPVIRLAQFSALMSMGERLFTQLNNSKSIDQIRDVFLASSPHKYWRSHYAFDKPVADKSALLGKAAIDNILINTLAPFLYMNGKRLDNHSLEIVAINILKSIPPENNSIITNWKELGISPQNAAESQALIQLKNEKCSFKKCLSCAIGEKLIFQRL